MTQSTLNEMYLFACSEGLFETNFLKHITATVCDQSVIEVIDFDKTKERVCSRLGLAEQLKSCDALKILFEKDMLVFIEMKSFQLFKKWHLANKNREEHSGAVISQIEKFNIPQKLIDSIFILDKVWEWSTIERDKELTITNVILTDIFLRDERNSEEFIEFTLLYLADESVSPDVLIQAQVLNYLENRFKLEDKPLLLDCRQLENYISASEALPLHRPCGVTSAQL